MSRILVTGSADGLGRLAAQSLLADGHDVVVHARNMARANALAPLVDRGSTLVVGDLAIRDDVQRLAEGLRNSVPLDAVIHNAGVWSGRDVMPVNVVAPYLLTVLLSSPRRLVYLSSSSHYSGRPSINEIDWRGEQAGSYEDSKLFITTLMAAVARRRPDLLCNAVDPGWVPTKMRGPGAPDDLDLGHQTQEWLATSDDPEARTTGGYWHHRGRRLPHAAVNDNGFQDELLDVLAQQTGARL